MIRNIYILFSRSETPIARDDEEVMDLADPSTPLPPWFSEEDLAVYASLYEKSGVRFALHVPYRALRIHCGIENPKITSHALLIVAQKDYVVTFPGLDDYVRSGKMKQLLPDVDIIFLEEGSRFVHEQLPQTVNDLIINFLEKHSR